MPKRYPDEFKQHAVTLATSHATPVAHIATDLDVSEAALRRWINDPTFNTAYSDPDVADTEIRDLKRKIHLQEQELEILRRSAAEGFSDGLGLVLGTVLVTLCHGFLLSVDLHSSDRLSEKPVAVQNVGWCPTAVRHQPT
jgi:transposase-like protein